MRRTDDRYRKAYFSPVKAGIFDRLTRLASAVDSGVELGYHLCYGDFGHAHFVQPKDTGLLVEVANEIVEKINPIQPDAYMQMPVPKDRVDEAYFKPMKNLELHGTKLFMGCVHPNDESGTRKRLKAAQTVYPKIAGVASECGLGRTPPEEIRSIFETYASVTA